MLADIQATIVLHAAAPAPAAALGADEEAGPDGLPGDGEEGEGGEGEERGRGRGAGAGGAAAEDGMRRVAEFVEANERHLRKVSSDRRVVRCVPQDKRRRMSGRKSASEAQ